jgi:hypothetical protein
MQIEEGFFLGFTFGHTPRNVQALCDITLALMPHMKVKTVLL